EEIQNQFIHTGGRVLHSAKIVLTQIVEFVTVISPQFIAETADGAKRGAQIVGNAITKAIERADGLFQIGCAFLNALFKFLSMAAQDFLSLSKGGLSGLSLSDIASDIGSADKRTRAIADRGYG